MTRRLKLAPTLSMLVTVFALALTGCAGEEAGGGEHALEEAPPSAPVYADSEEPGQGDIPTFTGDPATDDVAYLKLLGLARGRLIAFYELYTGGAAELAQAHVMRPQSELHSDLEEAFVARGKPGLAPALNILVDAAAVGSDVNQEYSAFIEAVNAHAPVNSPAFQLLAISQIVHAAADAFDLGVEDDGSISHAHDYLDAYGFLVAARDMLAGIETSDVSASDAISLAHEQVELALASFEGLTVKNTEGRASTLFSAATRIENAAHGLM